MNSELDYKSILIRLWKYYGGNMNDWENEFVDNLVDYKYEFSDRQKEIILKLNRKYITKR